MKKLKFVAVLVLIFSSALISQQSLIYVDDINGDDLMNDGKNPASDGAGSGPIKTINLALFQVPDGGTIVILAGRYDRGDLIINSHTAPNVKTRLTLRAQQQYQNPRVELISDSTVIDIDGLELNIEAASADACFYLTGKLIIGSTNKSVKANLPKPSSLRLKSKESLVLNGKSVFTNAMPEMGKN
jgi:hypothetical protein